MAPDNGDRLQAILDQNRTALRKIPGVITAVVALPLEFTGLEPEIWVLVRSKAKVKSVERAAQALLGVPVIAKVPDPLSQPPRGGLESV